MPLHSITIFDQMLLCDECHATPAVIDLNSLNATQEEAHLQSLPLMGGGCCEPHRRDNLPHSSTR